MAYCSSRKNKSLILCIDKTEYQSVRQQTGMERRENRGSYECNCS